MPITINGSGTVTGISAGGLPDDCITTAEIAAAAVTTAKLGSSEASGLAKAWVNFNGTGTVAIRASFNVSSITDNGQGNFAVNFTTAFLDINYAGVATSRGNSTSLAYGNATCMPNTTTSAKIGNGVEDVFAGETPTDPEWMSAAFFR
jgi:hypothetical protein